VGGVAGSVGIDDAFSARLHAAYAFHPAPVDSFHVVLGSLEVIYLLDVLEIVPFGGLGADALGTFFAGRAGVDLGAHLVLGVDYLVSREVLIGADVRAYYLPLDVSVDGVDPVYLTLGARLELIFEM
jgi:hypothetical protein